MNLRSVKTNKCPICGCDTVIAEYIDTTFDNTEVLEHCNGGRWEHRKFLCGYQVLYVPNFSREETTGNCRYDPQLIAQERMRREAIEAVKQTIDQVNCDRRFKERIMESLPAGY